MCGIVGYVGSRPAQELLLAGLRKLEYRGYDSAGISVVIDGEITSVRAVGNLDHLEEALDVDEERNGTQSAATGIAHTRWATHGRVNEVNAHPHSDNTDRVHVVVNGIVTVKVFADPDAVPVISGAYVNPLSTEISARITTVLP